MSDVFISYARKDKDFMQQLYDRLNAQQRDIWVDWEDIPSTADWWKEICNGIEAANAFVFIITPNSVRSEVCRNEVDYAVSHKKKLIPVLLQEISEPMDKSAMHKAISSHNWIYFRAHDDFESAFTKLTTALDTDLEHVRDHTGLLVKALEWDRNKSKRGFLLAGDQLQHAEMWLSAGLSKQPPPCEIHSQYIFASRKQATARQRSLVSGVLFALLISLVLVAIALYQAGQARNNAAQARALELAAYARTALLNDNNPDTALALALEAYHTYQPAPDDVNHTLAEIAYSPGLKWMVRGHDHSITGTAFSPDGHKAVTISADQTLKVWDLVSQTNTLTIDLDALPLTVAYHPTAEQVLIGLYDGTLKLYDLETGTELQSWQAHNDLVMSAVFTPDGQRVVSGGLDRMLNLWETETGALIRGMESSGAILDVSLSADGTQAVTGTADRTMSGIDPENEQDRSVRVWDLETGSITASFKPGGGFVRAVAFSPDGAWVAGSSYNSAEGVRIKIWDLTTNQVRTTLYGHGDIIQDVQFSPDGRLIASGSWDRSLRIYDARTGIELQRLEGNEDRILSVAFSADGQYVLTGTGNIGNNVPTISPDIELESALRLWDLETRSETLRFSAHSDPVFSVAFSPDGQLAASGSGSFSGALTHVFVWTVADGEIIHTFERYSDAITELAFSPDGQQLAVGAQNKSVRIYNLQTGHERLLGTMGSSVTGLVFDPTSRYLLSSDNLGSLVLWDVQRDTSQRYTGHPGRPVEALAFSPDGQIFASGSGDLTIRLWSVGQTEEPIRILTGHHSHIRAMAFSPDSTHLASVSGDRTAKVWDVASGTASTFLELEPIQAVAFPMNNRFAYMTQTVKIAEFSLDPQQPLREFNGLLDNVRSAAFSPDGNWAITGGDDHLVRLWNVDSSIEDTLEWIGQNRIADLTCNDRVRYQITPLCPS